jgi:tripartite ATP-independent transporter DctP family solute receptor
MMLLLVFLAACGSGGSQSGQTPGSSPSSGTSSPSAGSNGGSGGKPVELTLAHTLAETHILHLAAAKFAELAAEKSGGRITITIYPSGTLGNDLELIESTINGDVDASVVGVPFYSGFTPILDAYLLPFLIDSYEIERKVFDSPVHQEMLASLDSMGIVGLTLFEGGLVHIGNTKKEIRTPADMAGMKIRTGNSELAVESLRVQGANPTPMTLPEVYTGLQTNVIDGVQTNLVTIAAQKFYEVIDYVTIHGQYSFPAVAAMNKKRFESLSAEDQAILREAAKEATQYTLDEIEKLDADARQQIEAAGVKFIDLTPEEKQVFIEVTQGIFDKYLAKDPLIEKFVNAVLEMK